LVRGDAEERFELPDEMKGRDVRIAGQVSNRQGRMTCIPQALARVAQPSEAFMAEQHGRAQA
jgi:hypothetical protein